MAQEWGPTPIRVRMGIHTGEATVQGGDYFGPKGFYEMRGYPVKVGTTPAAKNEIDARRLWEVSEKLTGVSFESLKTNAA